MTLDDLERAKNLESCINSAKQNLEKYKRFKDAKEIKISISGMDTTQQPIYITGDRKTLMIDVLVTSAQIYLNDKYKQLEKL
jgi:hypothetical protein